MDLNASKRAARDAALELSVGLTPGAKEDAAAEIVDAFAREMQDALGLTHPYGLLQLAALRDRLRFSDAPREAAHEQR